MKKTTINDVALASGVSKATVSYVLNNKSSKIDLPIQTINRVLAVSKELDYRPNQVAVAFAKQRKRPLSILLLSPWLYMYYSNFMEQVNITLNKLSDEIELKMVYELYNCGKLSAAMRPAKFTKYDAVIIIGTSHEDDSFLIKNHEKYKNIILLNRIINGYTCVYSNDREITCSVADAIAQQQYYGNYVIVSGGNTSYVSNLRLEGYREGLKRNVSEIRIFEEHINDEKINVLEYINVGNLIDKYKNERTCYLFIRYNPAARFLTEAIRRNIIIPEEIGIVGYDNDSLINIFLTKKLTTIDSRITEMTRSAINLAHKMKEGINTESVMVSAEIIKGETALI